MDRIENYISKLSKDEMLDLRRKVFCAMNASDDKNWNNLLDCIELKITETILLISERFDKHDIDSLLNILSSYKR